MDCCYHRSKRMDKTIPDNLLTTHAEEIREILNLAVRHALWKHKQLGQSVAVSRNGKAVMIRPEEIEITEEDLIAIKKWEDRYTEKK